MYVPSTDPDSIDDTDYMSVAVGPKDYYMGLNHSEFRDTVEIFEGDDDVLQYELLKFARLLLKGNPNVISLLFLKPEHYIYVSPSGQKLIDNRDIFFSKNLIKSFCGYANAQLQKMGRNSGRGFRGEKRKELVERHGYDTKNAAHCMRLLRMCIEFLKTGVMNVDRTGIDAEELIAIKKGAWSMDRVVMESQSRFKELRSIKSVLPELPNEQRASELCMEIIEEILDHDSENSGEVKASE